MKSFRQYLEEKQVIQLEPGLSRDKALELAHKKRKGDARGFTYDPKSGKAVFI